MKNDEMLGRVFVCPKTGLCIYLIFSDIEWQ